MTREEVISKKAVMQVLAELGYGDEENGAEPEYMSALSDVAKEVKAIKALEPKTGYWIIANVGKLFPSNDFKCSKCGNILNFDGVNCGRGDANFCPNCGADMRTQAESEADNADSD